MALPSQSERSTPANRVMASGGGASGPSRMIAGLLLVAILAGGIIGVYALSKRGQPPAGTTPDANQGLGAAPTQNQTPRSLADVVAAGSAPAPGGTPVPAAPMAGRGSEPQINADATRDPADATKPTPVDLTKPDLAATPPRPPNSADRTPPAGGPSVPITPAASTMSVRALIDAGEQAFAQGNLVEARALFSRAYLDKDCSTGDQLGLREKLTAINRDLVFSPKVTPGDPLVESYKVESGDALDKIRRRRELTVDSAFIARINGMANPNALKVGQSLKLVRGPFHVVVDKSDFRMDIFAGSPDEPETWLFIRSFPIGLGAEESSTPLGLFRVRNKMKNPSWRNPRTGEFFAADDPKNPIGEYWIGWEGVGDSKVYVGFGMHGTIEPQSIGRQMSMGCVRMASDDIAMVYEMLTEQVSIVKVVP
jgi:lipoprotein-anchoring transpeptidase ErfK/SrfK